MNERGTFDPGNSYRYYTVWLLCLVYLFNQIDRQIFAILQHPIQREFGFSDTQLGLIGGTAFALFYATLGIPVARLADRGNRVTIISVSLALWSLFTAITGMAQTFWQLLLARAVVGIGEAGCSPPAYSVISDYFEPRRRSTAFSIYALGLPSGTVIGLLVTTAVAEAHGWRMAFYVMGLPGLLLACIVMLTVREPPRGFADRSVAVASVADVQAAPSLREFVTTLWRKRTFRCLLIATTLYALTANGIGAFYSMFLIRSHGLTLSETGQSLVLAAILGGLPATFLGGKLADLLSHRRQDLRWQLWIPAIALLANVPVGFLLYTAADRSMLPILLTINIGLSAVYLAPTVATIQRLVTPRARALVTAVLFFVMNLFGIGLGPILTGHLSDRFKVHLLATGTNLEQAAADGLRFAFVCMLLLPLLSVVFYLRSARTLRTETLT